MFWDSTFLPMVFFFLVFVRKAKKWLIFFSQAIGAKKYVTIFIPLCLVSFHILFKNFIINRCFVCLIPVTISDIHIYRSLHEFYYLGNWVNKLYVEQPTILHSSLVQLNKQMTILVLSVRRVLSTAVHITWWHVYVYAQWVFLAEYARFTTATSCWWLFSPSFNRVKSFTANTLNEIMRTCYSVLISGELPLVENGTYGDSKK